MHLGPSRRLWSRDAAHQWHVAQEAASVVTDAWPALACPDRRSAAGSQTLPWSTQSSGRGAWDRFPALSAPISAPVKQG